MGWFKRFHKPSLSPPPATLQMMDFLVGEINRIAQELGWIVRQVEAPLVIDGQVEGGDNTYKLRYYTPKGGATIRLTPELPYLQMQIHGTLGRQEDRIAVGHFVNENPGLIEIVHRDELVKKLKPYIEKYLE